MEGENSRRWLEKNKANLPDANGQINLVSYCVSSCLGMSILSVGVDIWWISDPTCVDMVVIFHPWVKPASAPRISGCGREFYFSPVGDSRISKILKFDGFNPFSPPKYLAVSKF
jgi:hypothetical protein